MTTCQITAYPFRIIPFDLGRYLTSEDKHEIETQILSNYRRITITPRQESILKGLYLAFYACENVQAYIYENGICVIAVREDSIGYYDNYMRFSIPYGENRKQAHNAFFNWEHRDSGTIWAIISELRKVVHRHTNAKKRIRVSGSELFENKGLSYIMTLSMFDISEEILRGSRFSMYPEWLKSNLYALLDPSVLYLEDSSKFESSSNIPFDLSRILSELQIDQELKDYERHRHISTYMSWAAVVTLGQLQKTDIEEYLALEIQLQCDWFYVYCLDKDLDHYQKLTKKEMIDIQRESYEIDLLDNRLYDFDDSSMPTRVLDIQKGLVETSGLNSGIEHLQRKIRYLLERERLGSELKQKKLGQSTEILLFIIAFIEIAPTVAEYGGRVFPNAGLVANVLIVILGVILLMGKT